MLCLPRRQRAPFCGHPWQRCLADAQPDEKIPEHLILFVDALSDPGPQSRQMDGLGWRCLAERRCPWNTAGVLHVDAGVVNTVGSAPPWPGRPPWCCRSSKAPSKRNPAGRSPSPPPREGVRCAGGCGQGGDGAGAHRVCGGPAFGQGLLLRGGEARRRRGVQCAGLRRHQVLPPHRAGRGAGHHRPGIDEAI